MALTRRMVGGIVLLGAAGGLPVAAETDDKGFIRITPDEVPWKTASGGGPSAATLFGEPAKAGGIYVQRVRFPPGAHSNPHYHPQDRHVTVIKGRWYTGTGDTLDFKKAVALKAGSYMMHPARAVHWDGAGPDEDVIVQIIGVGPAETIPIHPGAPASGYWPKPA